MATTDGGEPPAAEAPRSSDADVVITTVVSADDPRPDDPRPDDPPEPENGEVADAGDLADADAGDLADPDRDDLSWVWGDEEGQTIPSRRRPAPADEGSDTLAALETRLTALEAVPGSVEALGKAIRHELERCAGVLFGHDRALGTLAARVDAMEAPAVPLAGAEDEPGGEAGAALAPPVRPSDEAYARVADQLDRLARRLAAVESRVEPLEPVPTVIQALRRAVRASDDLITGESAAREQSVEALKTTLATEAQARDDALRRLVAQDLDRVSGVSTAQAKGLADVAERLAAAEGRLAPLDTVPDDVAALGRILRRELDAVVSDNQARDQMLRRALQNEIDQLRATSEAREALAQGLAVKVDALETRSAEAAQAGDQGLGAAVARLEALEGRLGDLDRMSGELQAVRDALATELEQLRTGGQAHDQLAGELTRRLSSLDGRLARLDPVPGEVQSLRTAMLQDAERAVSGLRATEERIGQLSWVPAEFQEARNRIIALTSGLQSAQDRVRQLEGALAATNDRLDALLTRMSAVAPPDAAG
jgi:DNA repair exonuclease SbcCD ATPase subunit